MTDTPQPTPDEWLLPDDKFVELVDEWRFHGGWQPHRSLVASLIATVEHWRDRAQTAEARLADAEAVIRRLLDFWTPDDSCDGPTWYLESGMDDDPDDFDGIDPMTSGEVEAIRRARTPQGDRE